MKAAVKKLVDSIEKEIQYIIENYEVYKYEISKDFDFGTIFFSLSVNEISEYGGEWDEILNSCEIDLELNYVDVTNENNKVLTNLSNEVYNQLEENYTNY
jgi:hypothetical protein